MWIRLLGAVCVIGAGALGGGLMGRQLRMRQERLTDGKRAVELLQAQIRSTGMPLPEALRQTGEHTGNAYGQAFSEIAERLLEYTGEPVSVIWEEVVFRRLDSACMKEQDIRQFASLGEQLGLADRKLQENILQRYVTYADGELQVLNGEVAQKCRLYRNLGILLGVFMTLILL